MTDPRELSITTAAAALRGAELTAEQLLQSYLERISAREAEVHAWVEIQADPALATARQCDIEAQAGRWRGPLHGIPIGAKDIFDVQGMTTRAGTEAYSPRVAECDAESVARLRAAGAIVLGKTVTTAFAMGDAGPTCNPWRLDHTPAGSSSGSGAAVADRMCAAALGSQTVGSVIRPAAYNGIVGFKPTYGGIPVGGVVPLSWQLDHVGSLTRTVADAHLLWQLMHHHAGHPFPALQARAPQKLWRLRDYFETEAEPEMLSAFDDTCRQLAAAGVEIVEKPLPGACTDLEDSHRAILTCDAAAYHQLNFESNPERYPPNIREAVSEGLNRSGIEYARALRHRRELIAQMTAELAEVDAAIMPAATGPAPAGLDFTGNRLFNTQTSFCGMPVVSLPVARSELGLPMAVQLMAGQQGESALFAIAEWCSQRIPFDHRP